MAFDYDIPYTESPNCGACGYKLRRVEERLATHSFPPAHWRLLRERRALRVVCPICEATTRMALSTPDALTEDAPSAAPADRPPGGAAENDLGIRALLREVDNARASMLSARKNCDDARSDVAMWAQAEQEFAARVEALLRSAEALGFVRQVEPPK